MAKSNKKLREKDFLKDYQKIVRELPHDSLVLKRQEWVSTGDFFVKFSLYNHDIPSTTSTGTIMLES